MLPSLTRPSIAYRLDIEYGRLRAQLVDCQWAQLMNHPTYADGSYESSDLAYRDFLRNPAHLAEVEQALSGNALSQNDRVTLSNWRRIFLQEVDCEDSTRKAWEELLMLESRHAEFVRALSVGYRCPESGNFQEVTAGALFSAVMTFAEEPRRKAVWEGMRKFERELIAGGLVGIIRKRNEVARAAGYSDFYEYKLRSEGWTKEKVFSFLDEFVKKTDHLCKLYVDKIAVRHGEAARNGWNFGYMSRGKDIRSASDFYSFNNMLINWGRTLNGLGVSFGGASITIDLLRRPEKHYNAFTLCRSPATLSPTGFRPATLFMSLDCNPEDLDCGQMALKSLFHEAGHCAHYSNIRMPSPGFSHGLPGALAEAQAMFFELLCSTPAWLARYARDSSGAPMPRELILDIANSQRSGLVYRLRNMAAVAYMERELYETSDNDLTVQSILDTSRRIDRNMTGLRDATHPLMTLSHFYSHDSAAYFHNYVIAELAAYQTIGVLECDHVSIVDNSTVGPKLAEAYWAAGNHQSIFDMVEKLTGEPLSPDSLLKLLDRPDDAFTEDVFRQVSQSLSMASPEHPVNLDLTLRIVHGVEELTSNTEGKNFEAIAHQFGAWLKNRPTLAPTAH